MGEMAKGRGTGAPPLDRRPVRRCRHPALDGDPARPGTPIARPAPGPGALARCAGLVAIGLLSACAGSPEPPGPLVVGGYLARTTYLTAPPLRAALPAPTRPRLATRLRGGTYLAIAPVLGPPEHQPAAAPAVRPPPAADPGPGSAAREPGSGGRRVWIPELKPTGQAPPEEVAATIWPSPPKPILVAVVWPSPPKPAPLDALAVAPAAAPVGSGEAAIRVDHGPADRDLGPGETIAVSDRAAALGALEGAAREALRADRPGEALELYEQVRILSPHDRAAALGRAAALSQLGRRSEAVAAYRTLLEADPGDLSAKIALLGLIAEDAPQEALRELGRLARQHPKDGRIAARSAMILARLDRFEQAIVELRRAVTLDPSNPTLWANLGILLDRAGRLDQAIAHYRTALRLATETGASSVHLDAIGTRLEHLSARRPS